MNNKYNEYCSGKWSIARRKKDSKRDCGKEAAV